MRVTIKFESDQLSVDREVSGANPDEVVATIKAEVAAKLGILPRMVVNAMTPLAFAQEIAKRYGQSIGRQLAVPQTCDEFLRMTVNAGIATVTED